MTRTRKLVAGLLLVSVVLASVLTAALATDNTETYAYLPDHSVYFYDVTEKYDWAYREIDTLAAAGVIQGSGNHLFLPDSAITRADFIVMLDRAFGMSQAVDSGQIDAQGVFVDVPGNTYYSKAITAAKAFGIATGTTDNRFLPKQSMTRQDAMVFLKRTLDWTQQALQTGTLTGFSDIGQISSYARDAVSALVNAKVISGSDGKLNPQTNVTRAEMAVMLYRATHLTGNGSSAAFRERNDIVNVCVGAQSYCDVVIENYNAGKRYAELMRYSNLRQENGVIYITLEENQQINYTAFYANGQFVFRDSQTGESIILPAASNCVAIDVTPPYHQMDAPVSTDNTYRHCYPSVVNGQVAAVYYTEV